MINEELEEVKVTNLKRQLIWDTTNKGEIYERLPKGEGLTMYCVPYAFMQMTGLDFIEFEKIVNKNMRFRKWNRKDMNDFLLEKVSKDFGCVKFELPRYRKLTLEEAYDIFGLSGIYSMKKHVSHIDDQGKLLDYKDTFDRKIDCIYFENTEANKKSLMDGKIFLKNKNKFTHLCMWLQYAKVFHFLNKAPRTGNRAEP